jgi:RNA polymerase sigma factor (sigma-70 family)
MRWNARLADEQLSGRVPMSRDARRFATTHWTLILTARNLSSSDARQALEDLCRLYWYPLYAFLRRQGYDADKAQDLTQGFFARLLEKHYLDDVRPERGRFRTFLLTSLKHFALNEHDREQAIKRGRGVRVVPLEVETAEGLYALEPRDDSTPESVFERRWALTLLDRALARVRSEYAGVGKEALFDRLRPYLVREDDARPYIALGSELEMSEGAIRVAVHRLRRRFAAVLRDEIASTVSSDREVDEELKYLSTVVRR